MTIPSETVEVYCAKCKANAASSDIEARTVKNGRSVIRSICVYCGLWADGKCKGCPFFLPDNLRTVPIRSTNLRRKLDIRSSLEAVMAVVWLGVLKFEEDRQDSDAP